MPVAVVTGSNKGIGFGIVRALCKKYDGDVYLTARDEARGLVRFEPLALLEFCDHLIILGSSRNFEERRTKPKVSLA